MLRGMGMESGNVAVSARTANLTTWAWQRLSASHFRAMTLDEVQKEAVALSAEERRKLAAFLTALRMKDELERTLEGRLAGEFEPLEGDWKERVRQSAAVPLNG